MRPGRESGPITPGIRWDFKRLTQRGVEDLMRPLRACRHGLLLVLKPSLVLSVPRYDRLRVAQYLFSRLTVVQLSCENRHKACERRAGNTRHLRGFRWYIGDPDPGGVNKKIEVRLDFDAALSELFSMERRQYAVPRLPLLVTIALALSAISGCGLSPSDSPATGSDDLGLPFGGYSAANEKPLSAILNWPRRWVTNHCSRIHVSAR